ncbi:hypothetical protein SD70_16850 [Gordoniibacillus kamchatkensis]|uniref:Major facilitator superfamily (MFS) profile domain-containing protein n=1 Tax=Gordoniibacillus kamchatkensis TaxID=1590651 RepID=A0ABR5AFS4_9BACL|nr:MFS transporter [Paenibacillus sp. VKM B-2647]KIL39900.1 hypothetical protein SD70_16850 [Paenibacillus sp. VKM B-2647]
MFRTFSSLPPQIRFFAVLIFIYHTGVSFIWPVYMPYMTRKLELSVALGGTLLSVHYALQFAGNLAGGLLFDRWKAKTTIALSSAIPMLCTVAIGFGGGVAAYTVCFMLLGFFSGFFYAVINAWAIRMWPSGGRRNANLVYVALNVAGAVGTALGGVTAAFSYSLAFWINAAFHLAFLALFYAYFRSRSLAGKTTKKPDSQLPAPPAPNAAHGNWTALALLSTGLMVTWFMYTQWLTVVPAIFQKLQLPAYSYNLLWTINAVMVVGAQPIVSKLIAKWRLSLKAQLITGACIFIVSSVVMAEAADYAGFVAAMAVMTLAEMLVWPSVPALAADYAESGKEGFVQGVVAGGPTAGRMLGPILGGMLFEHAGQTASLYASTACTLLGALCFFTFIALGRRTRQAAPQAAANTESAERRSAAP